MGVSIPFSTGEVDDASRSTKGKVFDIFVKRLDPAGAAALALDQHLRLSLARSKFPDTVKSDGARHMGSTVWLGLRVNGEREREREREREQVTSRSRYTPPYSGVYSPLYI